MMPFFSHIILILLTILPAIKSLQIVGEPIFHFSGKINGANPQSTLTEVNNTGILYGVTRYGGMFSGDFGVIYCIDTTLNNNFTVEIYFVSIL
jgi:hypothetical protein